MRDSRDCPRFAANGNRGGSGARHQAVEAAAVFVTNGSLLLRPVDVRGAFFVAAVCLLRLSRVCPANAANKASLHAGRGPFEPAVPQCLLVGFGHKQRPHGQSDAGNGKQSRGRYPNEPVLADRRRWWRSKRGRGSFHHRETGDAQKRKRSENPSADDTGGAVVVVARRLMTDSDEVERLELRTLLESGPDEDSLLEV